MKIWLYRIWFDLDNNSYGPREEEGTIKKLQMKNKSFIEDITLVKDFQNVLNYHVKFFKPSKCEAYIHSTFINIDTPVCYHVPGDDENMSSEGSDHYYMGFTYQEDQPTSEVLIRKRECISKCNEKILEELEKRKAEIEKSIAHLREINEIGCENE